MLNSPKRYWIKTLKPMEHRTSQEKGKDLEREVSDFLMTNQIVHERLRWVSTPFGRFEVDIYIPGDPPAVIECKNPTSEAKSKPGTIRRKVEETFFKIYMLQRHCSELPENTIYFLVLGDLPLLVDSKHFGERDYENFLQQALGTTFRIVRRSDLSPLCSRCQQ